MTFVREIVEEAVIGVGITETPEGLSLIHLSGCAAALWHRQPSSGFQSWIDGLDPGVWPRSRVILRPEAVRMALPSCLRQPKPVEVLHADPIFYAAPEGLSFSA